MTKYLVDIDGTICHTKESDYANAVPHYDRIEQINALARQGHTIVYYTARGMSRKIDSDPFESFHLQTLTVNQLKRWGCLFDDLVMWKPSADIYIDDKAINSKDFFND